VPPKDQSNIPVPDVPADQLIISVKGPDTNPKVFLNREELAGGKDGVKDRIAELMKGRHGNERVVFFQADNELPYQYVVDVMDQIRAGGADKIGLITDENMDVTQGAQ